MENIFLLQEKLLKKQIKTIEDQEEKQVESLKVLKLVEQQQKVKQNKEIFQRAVELKMK